MNYSKNEIIEILKEFEQQDYKRGGFSVAPEMYDAIADKIHRDLMGERKDSFNALSTSFIHQKIESIIPFISEEFITYPLWEEGKYIPFLKCWQKADTENECELLSKRLNDHFEKTGYEISFIGKEHISVIHEFYIYPKWKELKNGSYKFIKKDWSIEEMLELLASVLK